MEQELTPKKKQEVSQSEEQTRPGRYYIPDVDIFETDEAIWLRADMPGVSQDHVSVELDGDALSITGSVSTDEYEGLRPLYTEYNVGNFLRRFTLPNSGRFDRDAITAHLSDGVLEVKIPKAEKAKPRRIEVRTGA